MANKIRQQKQVRLGSRIYKLLKKKKKEKKTKKNLEKTNKKQSTQCLRETSENKKLITVDEVNFQFLCEG